MTHQMGPGVGGHSGGQSTKFKYELINECGEKVMLWRGGGRGVKHNNRQGCQAILAFLAFLAFQFHDDACPERGAFVGYGGADRL